VTWRQVAADLDERLRTFLKDLPSTNWTIFTGTLAGLFTCGAYLGAMLQGIQPEPVTFGIWCGTIAGWIGFGVRQFRVKRETDHELSSAARDAAGARLAGKPRPSGADAPSPIT
jgi:hypothetical protein